MAVVIFLVFILLIPIIASIFALLSDCDILLKCCELFGARPERKLRGKVVWVTGASSGIGECLAYELARFGCRLVLSGTRKDKLEEVKEHCAEIAEKDFQVQPYDKEQNILVVPLDLSQYHTHQQCTEQVLTHFGKVDILVNNGGRTQSALAMDCQAIEIEEAVMNINTLGTISLTKTVLQSMIQNKEGHVVVISSLAGKIGVPEASSYCASKFALEGYFYALRTELFQHGINITTVCPGPVVSRILENAFAEDPKMVYGDRVKFQGPGKRMPTLRCVELILVGIANQLDEIWITPRPLLLFFYLSQYFPFLFQTIFKRVGLEQIRKMRASTNTVKKTT